MRAAAVRLPAGRWGGAVARKKTLQTDFSAGQLAREIHNRRDTRQYEKGAALLRNGQAKIGGGDRRRPGMLKQVRKSSEFRCIEFTYDKDTLYVLAFGWGTMDAYLPGGELVGSITGAPWTGDIWREMDWVQQGNVILLTHRAMMCQVVRDTPTSWSVSAFPWSTTVSGRIKDPHFKVAPDDITITPSALSGSITLTLSSPGWWDAAHVGVHVRIFDREITITAVTDATTATGTVLDPLRPYQDLTVTSSAGFAVDEVVEGQTTGARGIVCSIPDATSVIVAVIENLTKFTAEGLIGPNVTTTIGSVADASPAPVLDWTEQAFSAVNGYADCVEIHRNRVHLFGGEAVPNGHAGSTLGDIFDFDIGDGSDSDGFYETVGDASATTIVQAHSTEQLLLLTDKGPYYVPESDSQPFRPSSLAYNHFGGTWETSRVRSADYDGGVIWTSGSAIIKATPTGDLRRAWVAREIQYLAGDVLSNMVDSCFVNNFGGDERFGIFVNDDGTAACMMLVDEEEIRNFRPWDTDGSIKSLCSHPGRVYACVERVVDGATVYQLEMFDHSLTVDGAVRGTDLAVMAAEIGAEEPHVLTESGLYLGTYPLALETVPAGPYVMGLHFDREIETLPPEIEDQQGSYAGEPMWINEAYIRVLESYQFRVDGHTLAPYQTGEDYSAAPPARTGWQRFTMLGWSTDPKVTITQPIPLPLTVLGLKTTVVY
jgi:hypothetical protein